MKEFDYCCNKNNSSNKNNKILHFRNKRVSIENDICELDNISKNIINTYNYPNSMDILDNFNTRLYMDKIFGLEQSSIIRDLARQITSYGYPGSIQWLNDVKDLFGQQVRVQQAILDIIQRSHNLITEFPVRSTSIASTINEKKKAAQAAATLCAKLNANMTSISNTNALYLNDPSYSNQIVLINTFGYVEADISKNVQVSSDGIDFLNQENSENTFGTSLDILKSGNLASITLWRLLVDSYKKDNIYWIFDNYKFSEIIEENIYRDTIEFYSNAEPLNYYIKSSQPSWCFSENENSNPLEVKKMEIILNSPDEIENFDFFYVPDNFIVKVNSSNISDDIWNISLDEDIVKFNKSIDKIGEIDTKKKFIRYTNSGKVLKVDEYKLLPYQIKKTIDQNIVILNTIQSFSMDWNKFQLDKLISDSNIIIDKVKDKKKQIFDIINNKSNSLQQELDDIKLDLLATSTTLSF